MEEIGDPIAPSGLSVTTPILKILGTLAIACVAIGIVVSHGSWLVAFVCLTLFGGSGAALLLMSGRIKADEKGIFVKRHCCFAPIFDWSHRLDRNHRRRVWWR
jgi:hypothetical protein